MPVNTKISCSASDEARKRLCGVNSIPLKNVTSNTRVGTNTCFNGECAKVCYYESDCGPSEMCRPFRGSDKDNLSSPDLLDKYYKKPNYSLCVPKDYEKYKIGCKKTNFSTTTSDINSLDVCMDWARSHSKFPNINNAFIFKPAPEHDLVTDSIEANLVCNNENQDRLKADVISRDVMQISKILIIMIIHPLNVKYQDLI